MADATTTQSRPDRPPPLVVLVVDDDPDCRLLVRDAVEEAEAQRGDGRPLEVREAESGEAAVSYLADAAGRPGDRPGLIYMDVEMPGMGGLEAVRRIKADPRLRDIPVVVLSGLSDGAAIGRAAANGANSYAVKPGDAEQLLKTVLTSTDYWLRVHQTPQRHAPQSECRR